MALFYLEERRNPSSDWNALFAMWPKTYDHFVQLYDEEALEVLEGTAIGDYIRMSVRRLKTVYEVLC